MQPRNQNGKQLMYIRIAFVTAIVFLLLLGAFQSIWVFGGSASSIMNQVGLQRARVQAITKNVLILAYRPITEHAQAVSELQNVLPIWERTQNGLKAGNASLQLPANVPGDIATLVSLAQSDYLAIDTAARVILAHTATPVDPLQLAIVVSHEHGYALAMTQVVNAWQQHIDAAFFHLYLIESGITLGLIALILLFYIFLARKLFKAMVS
jgi:hypothetical protein